MPNETLPNLQKFQRINFGAKFNPTASLEFSLTEYNPVFD